MRAFVKSRSRPGLSTAIQLEPSAIASRATMPDTTRPPPMNFERRLHACRRRGRGARRDLGRGRVVSDRRDACCKPVSVTRNRDDMPRLLRALPQGLAEQKDLLRQVAFFNHDIGPDRPEQFVFRDDAVAVRDEDDERIERFRRQRDGCAVAEEEAHLRQHLESFERPGRAGSGFGHDLAQILPPSGTLSIRVRRIEGVLRCT